jgi:D-galactose 1-dehydrogenase
MAIKTALVGIGKIARDQHIPSLAANPDFDLVAAVSRNAQLEGVDNYATLDELLAEQPNVELVSLCMPPAARFEYAASAIAAGRHVMLEKPPGATLSECHELVRLAKAKGVCLFATWHSRSAAAVPAAKAWLADKQLRELTIIWKEDVRRWHPGQDWIWQVGGLGVFDPGINALSILTEILPQAVHLTKSDLWFPENRQTPIAAKLEFAHPDGAAVQADFDWRQQGDQIWTINAKTDAGDLTLLNGGDKMLVDGMSHDIAKSAPLNGEYADLYAQMAHLVASGLSDVDLSPMTHVVDAFALGTRHVVEAFYD